MKPTNWEYCTIIFRTYHNSGGGGYTGVTAFNLGLLWFEANAKGGNGRFTAAKSAEIPFAQVAEGYPQEKHPAHQEAHRNLVLALKKEGWQPVSGGGAGWWEQRFRREASSAPKTLVQKIRALFQRP